MDDVTHILSAIEGGDQQAAEKLLPLIYEELRRLASQRLAREDPGQSLQSSDLVHEAYLRLVREGDQKEWDGRSHFFAAAAEAMRRILVENVRRKNRLKHGGGRLRVELEAAGISWRTTDPKTSKRSTGRSTSWRRKTRRRPSSSSSASSPA